MNRRIPSLLAALSLCFASSGADAHVSLPPSPAFANATQEITFGVGHGCTGADTFSVRIEIPAAVKAVRAVPSPFGKATVETDDTGAVKAVLWQKADADVLAGDTQYYKLSIRIKVPDQPFTTLYFPARQTCKSANGTLTVVDWADTAAGTAGGEEVKSAPTLNIVPSRHPGWNKYVVAQPVSNLGAFFADAAIVWKAAAAYSANPTTMGLIRATAGVTELTTLVSGDEIWVKY